MITDFFEPITVLKQARKSDGMGGYNIVRKADRKLEAGIFAQNQRESYVADKAGNLATHVVMTRRGGGLVYGTLIERANGETLRITANPDPAPRVSCLDVQSMTAEVVT